MEVHNAANTEQDQAADHRYRGREDTLSLFHMRQFFLYILGFFLLGSFEAEEAANNSGTLSGNEDVVSLSDIVPETNICFVSIKTTTGNKTVGGGDKLAILLDTSG